MRIIDKLSLRQMLLVLMFVPAVTMLWYGQAAVRASLKQSDAGATLAAFTAIAVATSELLHELQIERGLSAAYLGSAGHAFSADLATQNKKVDDYHRKYQERLAGIKNGLLNEAEANAYADVEARMATIGALRGKIGRLEIPSNEAVKQYNGINARLLRSIQSLIARSTDPSVANAASAYGYFLQAKELAGQERAVGAANIARGQFSADSFEQFSDLISSQDTYLSIVNSLLNPEQARFFRTTIDGAILDEIRQMRGQAKTYGLSGQMNLEADRWFDMQSQKIDGMKSIEDRLASDLQGLANARSAIATHDAWTAVVICVVALLLTVAIGGYVFRAIYRNIGADPSHLYNIVTEIAAGNLDAALGDPSGSTGVFAEIQKMQANLRDDIEASRKTLRSNIRIRQALDDASSAVMMVDQECIIRYLNIAAKTLFARVEADLRQEIPGFAADSLIGQNTSVLMPPATGQTGTLESIKQPAEFDVKIGSRRFRITLSPAFSDDGERLGTVLEWVDRTAEKAIEKEVAEIVERANQGDLSGRIDLEGKAGFFAALSQGVNELLDLSARVTDDTLRVMAALAEGRLNERIDTAYLGKYLELKDSANATVARLDETVQSILTSADHVAADAAKLSNGNARLSERTEEQAANLTQTRSSMNELTRTVGENAEYARQADKLAAETRKQAERGGAVVSDAVGAMQTISDASERMSDIIGVIDAIAFQTNLLALNASVEAARAGEQGRGFAVVATEVRNLAGRSAEAAKEIKHLIETNAAQIGAGAHLVNQSGETLSDIVAGITKVSDIVAEIAAASEAQSTAIEQINSSMEVIENMTVNNRTLVEEASSASHSLHDEAGKLAELMSFFERKNVSQFASGVARAESETEPLRVAS